MDSSKTTPQFIPLTDAIKDEQAADKECKGNIENDSPDTPEAIGYPTSVVTIDENTLYDSLFENLQQCFDFDKNELETMKMITKELRKQTISPPRQLGDWIRVRVNACANPKVITSTDEKCNFHGTSAYVQSFLCFQFGKTPSIEHISVNKGLIGWSTMTKKAIEAIKVFHLNKINTDDALVEKVKRTK